MALLFPAFAGMVRGEDRFELSLASVSYDGLEFASLPVEVRQRNRALSEQAFTHLLQKNLQFIYHNKLNRSRFLVAPDATYLVERIGRLYRANREIDALLREGMAMLVVWREPRRAALGKVVGQLIEQNTLMRGEFSSCFIDTHDSHYEIHLPRSGELPAQVSLLLVQARQLQRKIMEELDAYFLNRTPGATNLADYHRASLGTLIRTLDMALEGADRLLDDRK